MQGRVIVFGIDGGSFDYLQPLMDMGYMPNLRSFMDGGLSCDLQSTFPPLTSPAWLSLTSGKSPGKLGVYEFVMLDKKDRSLRFFNYDRYQLMPELWDILNMHGLTCTLVNHPLMAQPITVDSYCIPGMLSPDDYRTYPPELRKDLDRLVNGYRIDVRGFNVLKPPDVVKEAASVMEKRARVFAYLLDQRRSDFFLGFFTGSDRVCHSLLNLVDLEDGDNPNTRLFAGFFEQLDAHLGKLFSFAGDEDHVFIVSDHGFCRTEKAFYVNQWLFNRGYLSLGEGKTPAAGGFNLYDFARTLSRLHLLRPLLKITPSRLQRGIRNRLRMGSEYTTGISIVDIINDGLLDWESTEAVATPSGNIYITCGESEREAVRKKLTEELRELAKEEGSGRMQVYSYRDRYGGEPEGLHPDILCDLWNGIKAVTNLDIDGGEVFGSIARADHTDRGILAAQGPSISRNRIPSARIEDITPTLLHLMGLPIPVNVDGRIIEDAFSPGFNPADGAGVVLPGKGIAELLRIRKLARKTGSSAE